MMEKQKYYVFQYHPTFSSWLEALFNPKIVYEKHAGPYVSSYEEI